MHLRIWLVLAILAVSSHALAQSFGFGMGSDDQRRIGAGAPAPPTHILLLVGGGDILLVEGGNLQCVGSC